MNLWKAGKFLSLTAQAFSINSYVLANVWYRTAVVDVKSGDVSRMVSSIKSWIYQDLLVKPQEELLYRKTEDGGHGLFNIEAKAKANLTTSFLQTAGGSDFVTNWYHYFVTICSCT